MMRKGCREIRAVQIEKKNNAYGPCGQEVTNRQVRKSYRKIRTIQLEKKIHAGPAQGSLQSAKVV